MKIRVVACFLTVAYLSIYPPAFATEANSTEKYRMEKEIMDLSDDLHQEIMALSSYGNLKSFCQNRQYRSTIYQLMDQLHEYHDKLEADLLDSTFSHSKGTIKRILRHMDRLDAKYNRAAFTDFFAESCSFQNKIEKNSNHYKAGFGTHSYSGKVHTQEVMMYRYLKRLNRKVNRIKKHVEHLYIKQKVWRH